MIIHSKSNPQSLLTGLPYHRPTFGGVSKVVADPPSPVTLVLLLQKRFNSLGELDELLGYLRSLKTPYSALYPLKRVKGRLIKVHRLKLNSYQRYIYINPVEGVFISYHNANKFPVSPNYILQLNDINQAALITEPSWYQKKNNHYFQVKTASQKSIFYSDNLDMVQFWVNEIHQSQRFYKWLKALMDKRYGGPNSLSFIEKCDELINFLMNISIPEVDIDQYKISMGIGAEEYANKKANELRSSFFSSQQSGGSQTHSADLNANRLASSEELSDSSNPRSAVAGAGAEPKAAGEGDKIIYKFDPTEASMPNDHQLKKQIDQMAKIQDAMIKAEMEDTDESESGGFNKQVETRLEQRKNVSKSTTLALSEQKLPKLLEDAQKGLGYTSFQLLDILG
jgi:hypothetical protein